MIEARVDGPALATLPRIRKPVATSGRRRLPVVLIPLFIACLALPIIFYAGTVRLSPYRLVLIVMFIPSVIAWITGKTGAIRSPDLFILLTAAWGVIALFVNHDESIGLKTGGILVIETLGSYLLARWLIRDRSSFEMMVRVLFSMVVTLLPFALFESFTGRPILLDLFGNAFTVVPIAEMEARYGLHRAQGPFEHSILFGVICASTFGLVSYVIGKKGSSVGKAFRGGLIAVAVLCSISAGAFLSVTTQLYLMIWDRVTRSVAGRWRVLGLLATAAFFVVDAISHRSPFQVFIDYFTFNLSTAYDRVLIYRYGSQEVMRHPFFGIGLNDWARPWWMASSSVDNFWLLTAMMYGVPCLIFLVAAIALIFIKLGRVRNVSYATKACRTGLLISLSGTIMSVFTVHLWTASYCLFFFLLGSGIWILDVEAKTQSTPSRKSSVVTRRKEAVCLT